MYRLILISFMFLSALFNGLSAQTTLSTNPPDTSEYPYWIEMMQNPDVNFFDVQRAFNTYWEGREVTKGSGFKPFKRWEYRMQISGINPDGFRKPADYYWNEYHKYLDSHPGARSESGNWVSLGPTMLPNGREYKGLGRLNAIAFHPTDEDIIYVGSPSGGLWKTTVGGNDWEPLIDDLPTLGVSAIIIDYIDPDIILIGTGDRDAGDAQGMGVFRSTDGGETWEPWKTGMGNRTVGRLLQHPTNHLMILAATDGGMYRSTNGGESWTQVKTGNFKDVVFKPGDPNTVYGAASGNIYKSTDNGLTFTQLTNGLPGSSRAAIAVTPANPNYIYVILTNGDSFKALYRSTNNGQSFTMQSDSPNIMSWGCTGGDGGQAWYDLDIAADPNDEDLIFAGGVNCFKSPNGGVTWQISSHWYGGCSVPAVHADLHVLEYNPINDILYAGNDGGIYFSEDQGVNWTLISNGLVISQVYKIGQSATQKDKVLNGYQDNGTSTYMGDYWQFTRGGDGMECAVDPKDAAYSYATVYYGNIDRHYNNNFQANVASNGNYGLTEEGGWITPFCIDEENPNIMYVGYKNIWRCTNVKAPSSQIQWHNITSALGFNSTNFRVLETCPADPRILYGVKENNTIYRCDNARYYDPIWYTLTSFLPASGDILDIECHPDNTDIIFLSQNNKIWRSEDRGLNWTNISGTLPNVPFTSIAYYKRSNEGLYISSDIGVFFKDAFMSDWVMFSNGLTIDASINEVEIYCDPDSAVNDVIRAGTYGRGMWESDLYHYTPEADFEASETLISPGCEISFKDLSAGIPTSWTWTFDGAVPSTSDEQHPTNIMYSTVGTFQVKLVIMNEAGTDSLEIIDYITVSDTVLPAVAFSASKTSICTNEMVYFTDSTTHCPATWLWEITPSTIAFRQNTNQNSQHPVVEFLDPGHYTIKLTVSNSNGSSELTKIDYIFAGGYDLPYSEDFESGTLAERGWTIVNPDFNYTWSDYLIEETGNHVAKMKFYGYFKLKERDQLISPILNFEGFDNVTLTFKHAYAQRFNQKDSLLVYISSDCGESWTKLWENGPDGNGIFETSPANPYEFIPTIEDDWCSHGWGAECTEIDLQEWVGMNNIQIKFETVNDLGNNLYIDDIYVSNSVGIPDVKTFGKQFEIYPNPSNGKFTLISNDVEGKVTIAVYDLQGRMIYSTNQQVMGALNAEIDLSSVGKGFYMIQVQSEDSREIHKLIIE